MRKDLRRKLKSEKIQKWKQKKKKKNEKLEKKSWEYKAAESRKPEMLFVPHNVAKLIQIHTSGCTMIMRQTEHNVN